jgi:hypothetical protein
LRQTARWLLAFVLLNDFSVFGFLKTFAAFVRFVNYYMFSANEVRFFVFDNDFSVFRAVQQRFYVAFHFRFGNFILSAYRMEQQVEFVKQKTGKILLASHPDLFDGYPDWMAGYLILFDGELNLFAGYPDLLAGYLN